MRRPSGSMIAALLGALVISIGSAVGAVVYSELGNVELTLSAMALSFALALGAVVLLRDRSFERKFSEASDIRGEIRRLQLNLDRLERRIDGLRTQQSAPETPAEPTMPPPPPQPSLAEELAGFRRALHDIAAEQAVTPPPVRVDLATLAASGHQLELYLEPIVDLASHRTMHYRAAAALEAPDGRHVPPEELARKLNSHTLRPALDIYCLTRALPLTRKLVLRRQNALIFIPIAGETLGNGDAMRQLAKLLASDEGFAPAVAFEIKHRTMASLPASGVEGLAMLARQGAAMALTDIVPQGVDLAALRALRFAFLSFQAENLPKGSPGKPEWAGLARFAADHGFAVELRGLDNAGEAARARKWTSLGSGSAFAPRRRVRSEAGAAGSFSDAA